MPRLPDSNVLGGLPSANSGRPMASLDLSAPAKAMESVAQGVKDLGKGIASGLNSIADRNKEDDELVALKAKSGLATDLVALDKEEAGQNDPAELAKFPERRQALFQKYADQIPNAKTKQRWTYEMAPKIAQWGVKTQDRIDGIEKDKFFAEANGNIDLMRELAIDPEVDPETRDTALGVVNDYIDTMKNKGWLTEQEAEKRRTKWTHDYAWDSLQMMTPRERAMAVTAPYETNEREKQAYQFFLSKGWSPAQAAGIVGNLSHESVGMGTTARAKGDGADGSDSIGLAQWNAERARALKAFAAARGADWHDFQTQLEFVDYELNSSHAGAAEALRSAKTVADATSVFAEKYERPAGSGRGGYDDLHGWTSRYNRATSIGEKFAGLAPESMRARSLAGFLPPDERQKLYDAAEREFQQSARKDQQQRQAEATSVKSLIEDDRGSIMATGKPLDVLTEERVRSVMGDQAAEAFKQDRFYAQRFWEQTNDMDGLPAEAIRARLSQLDPAKNGEAGKPGFGVASGYHSMAEKKAQAILDERAKDPAAAADRQKDMEEVRQGADLASAPQSYVPLVRRRMAVQERLGVPAQNRMPLTNAEATAIFKPVATALPGQEKDALEQTVKLLQVALGGDKDLIDAALEQGLKQAHVEKNTREIAARLLRKIGMGETVQRSDAEAVTEARKQDAQASAASALLSATREAPAGPGVTASQESGVEMVGQRLAESGPRQSSMTRDELAQLWSMPSNKKMLESYTKTFGPDVVKRALEARPKDWDANLYKRHQSGAAQAPKRQLQFGAGSTGVFEQMRQQRDGAGAP